MRRYLKLLFSFTRLAFLSNTAYRPSFILGILGKVLRVGLMVVFFQAIYAQVPSISGWSYHQVLLVIGSFSLVDFLIGITFERNLLYFLPQEIKNGNFDFYLVKPLNLVFYTALRRIDTFDLISGIISLGLIIYAISLLGLNSVWQIIGYIFLLVLGYLVFFSLYLLVATILFWSPTEIGMGRMMTSFGQMARVPTDVFEGPLRSIFYFILPIAFVATVPAQVFRGGLEPDLVIYGVVFISFLFLVSLLVFNYGIKKYTSAGG